MTETDKESRMHSGLPWHANTAELALNSLESSSSGLSGNEASRRLEHYGPNRIQQKATDGPLQILWRQVNNPLIWVLVASSLIAMALGKATDGIVVMAVVILNSLIGFFQEYKAGKAIEALIHLVPDNAAALRDGRRIMVPSSEIVPGDIVFLASGDKVPADMRLIHARNLQIEEAALTGESLPVQKQVDKVDLSASIGDRLNMTYSGTMVSYGTGTAVVVATGMKTELGRISDMMEKASVLQTPLTKALNRIAHFLTLWITGITLILCGFSLWRGFPFSDALLVGVTLAVAAIPEGLPAVVTIALAIGVQRMARRRAVIRKLPAVETLGSTTVICSDKTGTLTRNEMTVQALWLPGQLYAVSGVGYEPKGGLFADEHEVRENPPEVAEVLKALVLCNDATLYFDDNMWGINGDPTEGALIVAAEKLGIASEPLRKSHERIDTVPFESQHKYMATMVRNPDGTKIAYIKGAPEILLKKCTRLASGDQFRGQSVLDTVDRLATQGMRVLAVASKHMAHSRDELSAHDIESGFTFMGLVGMIDPPRAEAIQAVRRCHEAGITVKMITGDHKSTAQAVGRELGIIQTDGTVSGSQLDEMSDEEFFDTAHRCNVFARVAPEHKLRLVCALQSSGNVVAMTGDGVNDAPALKQADIGVAMGINGTAVSKEAADIVLTDDNFASIAAAVEEGRRVYDNLIKSLAFLLPTNLGLAFILMFAVLFFPLQEVEGRILPLMPMLPTQILWINLVAAVALALPLGFEAKEPNIMLRPPRIPDTPVLGGFVLFRTVLVALLMAAGAVGLFYYEYASQVLTAGGSYTEAVHAEALKEGQTEAVTTVLMFQIFYLLNCRSLRHSVLKMGLFSNPAIYLGIAVVLILHLGFVYLGFMQRAFHTVALSPSDLLEAILTGMVILPVIWIEKTVRKAITGKDSMM